MTTIGGPDPSLVKPAAPVPGTGAPPAAPGAVPGTSSAGSASPPPPLQGDSLQTIPGGETSLIGADGKAFSGWGYVQAPAEPPIKDFGGEKMPTFGQTTLPAQGASSPGVTTTATTVPSNPIHNNKWSIITGPPQGDG